MTRPEALAALLALPNPPGDYGYRYTYARHPNGACGPLSARRNASSDPWQIKRDLGIAFAEHSRQAWTNGDISCVVSVRRLRMVRRA